MAETSHAGLRALVVGGDGSTVPGAIAARLRAAGATVETLSWDAAAADPMGAVVGAATRSGGLDIMVHVSALSTSVPFLDRSDASWAADLDSRIGAPIRLARAAADVMRATGGGSIVFVGTPDATHAYHGHADASVAMGALGGLVRSLAVELAPIGVRANAVLSGPLEDAAAGADPALVERTLLRSPSKRFVTADEVAQAVLFVGGTQAGFMTGASLRVDAGWASLNQAPDGMRFP